MNYANFLLYILIAPFIGSIFIGAGRKFLPKPIASILGSLTVLFSFILSLTLFFFFKNGEEVIINNHLFNFIEVKTFQLIVNLSCDKLTSIYLLIVTGVGFLIHIFSIGYMYKDEGFVKYFSYLNFFIFSMLLLILGSNLVTLFMGWESVGLCSYLLIGFWYKNDSFNYAARKAFIMNRIADLGLLFAIFWTFKVFGTLEIYTIQQSLFDVSVSSSDATIITISLLIAAIGKSAQIPLFTWLPDAMAGPTPVSALIHAATMVTAGVYLVAKMYFLFDLAPFTQTLILYIGLTTALIGATIAIIQNDIKKVLAYSTVSQLGFMFIALGIGNYTAAVFHVTTHAFFKALLFLGSASIIHAMNGEQDIRKMGGLTKKLPHTHLTFLIGCLAISGIPGLSGFFSKDMILNALLTNHITLIYSIALLTAFFTAFYMFRMYFVVFHGKCRAKTSVQEKIHESPWIMLLPLYILAFMSVIGGYINIPQIFNGQSWLTNYLNIPTKTIANPLHLSHLTEYIIMLFILLVTLGIIFYCHKIYIKNKITPHLKTAFSKLLFNSYYIDDFYSLFIIKPLFFISSILKNAFEILIDGAVEGVGIFVIYLSKRMRFLQSGYINNYMFWFVIGILLMFLIFIL